VTGRVALVKEGEVLLGLLESTFEGALGAQGAMKNRKRG